MVDSIVKSVIEQQAQQRDSAAASFVSCRIPAATTGPLRPNCARIRPTAHESETYGASVPLWGLIAMRLGGDLKRLQAPRDQSPSRTHVLHFVVLEQCATATRRHDTPLQTPSSSRRAADQGAIGPFCPSTSYGVLRRRSGHLTRVLVPTHRCRSVAARPTQQRRNGAATA